MNENALDVLLSTIPYAWKTNIYNGYFYAGFATKFGNVGFEFDASNWNKVNVPIIPRVPNNTNIENSGDILEDLANTNLRYPSQEDIRLINSVVYEDILTAYSTEIDARRYISFYMG